VTTEVFKSIASAKGIAFILVAWGVPVAIGMAAWWLVAMPAWQDYLLPDEMLRRVDQSGLADGWLFLAAWLLLTVALGLNATFFFRLYEGYYVPPPISRRRARTHWLHREYLRMCENVVIKETKLKQANRADPASNQQVEALRSDTADAKNVVKRRLLPIRRAMNARPLGGLKNWRDYPAKEADLLPTALGNRIRAFERYGNDRFGLDVLILWYEFVGVAEDQVREQIEAARQEVEVFLAGTVVFALFTVATWAPLANPHAWDDLGVAGQDVDDRPVRSG
jgi:hypothetical protein